MESASFREPESPDSVVSLRRNPCQRTTSSAVEPFQYDDRFRLSSLISAVSELVRLVLTGKVVLGLSSLQ